MSIDSSFRRTGTHYPQPTAQSGTQGSAPRASDTQKGPHAIKFSEGAAKGPTLKSTSQNAVIADLNQVLKGVMELLGSLMDRIKTLIGGLDQKKKTNPSNTDKPGNTPKANNDPAHTTHTGRLDHKNKAPDAQPSHIDKSGYEPKAGKPYSTKDLVGGFSQKPGSMNCVTVAGIKAAMQRFGGPNEVYLSVKKTPEGYDVKMRDQPNKTYHVTNKELEYATSRSGFKSNNQKILNDANFMYAVSAKRAQVENNDGYASRGFKAAVSSLDTWEHTREGLNRLGLKNHVQRTTAHELARGAPGVMAQNDHVFTVLNGRMENYGTSGHRPDPRAEAFKLR